MDKNIYFVTGASSDLGLAFLERLPISESDVVVAHYHNKADRLIELADRKHLNLKLVRGDFSSREGRAKFVDRLKALDVTPTHFIHICSNLLHLRRFKEMEEADFDMDFGVQVLSAVSILTEFLPKMAKAKRGKILMVLTSGVMNKPPKFMSSYVTSKYALLGLMKSLVAEYADKNIQINAVSPSMMETKFLTNVNSKVAEVSALQNPNKRNAAVADVVPTMLYLLGKETDFLNGVNIPITGGSEY